MNLIPLINLAIYILIAYSTFSYIRNHYPEIHIISALVLSIWLFVFFWIIEAVRIIFRKFKTNKA